MTWFSTPWFWGYNLDPSSTGLGLALSVPLAGFQNSRKSWWLPMEQLSEGGGGRGRAGWKLRAQGYPAGCPRRQASPESGLRHVEGQGLSPPCELRNLPEPTHQPRPCQATFLPYLLTPSGQSLGLPGETEARGSKTDGHGPSEPGFMQPP